MVAAVLEDDRGRILLARRPPGKHLAGCWEFPGGKLVADETPAQALVRELAEELGISVQRSEPLLGLTHTYPDRVIRLLLRRVTSWQGKPRGCEGQALAWVDLAEATRLPMPAADRPMLKALALAPRYAISADPSCFSGPAAFLAAWEAGLRSGHRWLQLPSSMPVETGLLDLAKACGRLARRYGACWLLNGPPALAEQAGADGVHLSVAALRACRARPLDESAIVCASCDDRADLVLAGELGLDFVTLSPPALGPQGAAATSDWPGFAALCAHSPLPVLALVGVGADELHLARRHGAFGVAGPLDALS